MEAAMDKVANLRRPLPRLEIPIQTEFFGPIEVPLIWPHNNLVGPNHLLI